MLQNVVKKSVVSRSCCYRSLSTATDYSYVSKRRDYQQELSCFRKEFMLENARKVAHLKKKKEEERRLIMKAKEARLALKKKMSLMRLAEIEEERKVQLAEDAVRFEEKKKVRSEEEQKREVRREAILRHLRKEAQSEWITMDKLDEKLKDDVFLYTPEHLNFQETFRGQEGSARSWLEKLQSMRPIGRNDE